MLKNAMAAVGVVSIVALTTSAVLRQVPVTPAQTTTPSCASVRPDQLVSFHEDFPITSAPVTRQLLASVPDNGLVVTSVTVSTVYTSSGLWSCDLLENNNTVRIGLAGFAGAGSIKPEVSTPWPGVPIAPRASLALRVPATQCPLRITVTGYVW